MSVHKKLKLEREKLNLSQLEVSLFANINQAIYSKIERGIIKPSPNQLKLIQTCFGVKSKQI